MRRETYNFMLTFIINNFPINLTNYVYIFQSLEFVDFFPRLDSIRREDYANGLAVRLKPGISRTTYRLLPRIFEIWYGPLYFGFNLLFTPGVVRVSSLTHKRLRCI